MGIRDRIDILFEAWGHTAFRHRWSLILAMLVVTAVFCSGLGRVTIEASTENLLQRDDPARVTYDRFRSEFSNDETILLVIHPEEIFSFAFLEKLRNLHWDLEGEMPFLDRVLSLINARVTRGEEGGLIVEDLLEQWPSSREELEAISARARANPAYLNTLLSEDGRYTAITIEIMPRNFGGEGADADADAGEMSRDFERVGVPEAQVEGEDAVVLPARVIDNEELKAIVETLESVVSRYASEDFEIHVTGGPPVRYAVLQLLTADMRLFTGLSTALVSVLLYLFFRRISGVLVALVVVESALACTFGFMGLAGLPITPTSQILPSLLLAICVGDAIHILAIFYREYDRESDKEKAIAFALRHSGLAVVLTSLTTAGGFGSFAFADLSPIVGFGLAASLGIILALIYSLVLLPALIAVLPIGGRTRVPLPGTVGGFDRMLTAIGEVSTRRPGIVISIWSALILVALYGVLQLRFSYAPQKWFPDDSTVRIAWNTANRAMKGVVALEVLLDSGRQNGLYDPELMNRLDAMHRMAEAMTVDTVRAGKAISIVDVLKETHQALNGNDPAYYVIPQSRKLIAQELLLFESSGSDDLERFVDAGFQKTRMTLLIPFEDGLHNIPYVRKAREIFQEMAGEIADVEVTGLTALYARTVSALWRSTARSYIIALIVIAPLLILLIGHVGTGLVSLIPNLTPMIMGLGLMYWAGFTLDIITYLVGCIIISVAVDDTIHFMYNFRRYYGERREVSAAVRDTLLSTGRAIVVSSVALCFGFLVFMFSSMNTVKGFGVVTSFAVVAAALADLCFLPALLTLVTRSEEGRRKASVEVPVLLAPSGVRERGTGEERYHAAVPEGQQAENRVQMKE